MKENLRGKFSGICQRAKEWFRTNGSKILLFLAFLFIGALSFESGFLFGRDRRVEPLLIEKHITAPCPTSENPVSLKSETPPVSNQKETTPSSNVSDASSCMYVGSKNSNKYHLPKCSYAKRIKPENRVCFSSASDAESKGYVAGCVK